MFYPSITMLLHCKTYAFGKSNLFFDQIKENSSLDGEERVSRKKKAKIVTKGSISYTVKVDKLDASRYKQIIENRQTSITG